MEDIGYTHTFICVDGHPCRSYMPGHHIHHIHARLVSESPESFRDAIVASVDGNDAVITLLETETAVPVWNHHELDVYLRPGDPVSLHLKYNVLATGRGMFYLKVMRET